MQLKSIFLSSMIATSLIVVPVAKAQTNWPVFKGKVEQGQAMSLDPERGVMTIAPILEKVTPAVVNIAVTSTVKIPANPFANDEFFERFFGDSVPGLGELFDDEGRSRTLQSAGSGVIIDARKGYLLTNYHVIDKADKIVVTLKDRRTSDATLVGSDPGTDIALLKIEIGNLEAIPFADSDQTKIGDYVIAIGNSYGIGQTVTSGIVSALNRTTFAQGKYQNFIQTDAAINQGNSGGALINSKGELIGINTAILSRSGGSNGIGFAVPTNMIIKIMDQLIDYGEVRRGRIGVTIQDITPKLMHAMNLSSRHGALVSQVMNDSPAERAGLKAGDVIITFNGIEIKDADGIRNAVGFVERGKTVDISYLRNGKKNTTKIKVEKAPDDKDLARDEKPGQPESSTTPDFSAFDGASFSNIPANTDPAGGKKGVIITNVKRASGAYDFGLRKGDIVRRVNNKKINNLAEFKKKLAEVKGPVALTIQRGRSQVFIAVE